MVILQKRDKLEIFSDALKKEIAMTPRAKLLNKLDSLQAEAGAAAGQIHSVCNEYKEILYGYDKVELYRLEALLGRLETTEKVVSHLWGLANFTYITELREHLEKDYAEAIENVEDNEGRRN